MRLSTYRRTSQLIFTVLTLGGLFGIATTGIIYPYFFCYSCPWDVGACPIGIGEHAFGQMSLNGISAGLPLLGFLIGFLSLMAIIFGRAFCGWACPMGFLQDISRKLGISTKMKGILKTTIDPRWKYGKFLMLIVHSAPNVAVRQIMSSDFDFRPDAPPATPAIGSRAAPPIGLSCFLSSAFAS